MRSVTLPLLMFCLGLAACSGDGGRRPSTCEVISPPDVMVPTEQNRQRVEQCALRVGDEVQIGKYRMTYHPGPQRSAAAR